MKINTYIQRILIALTAAAVFVIQNVKAVTLLYNNTTWGGGFVNSSSNLSMINNSLYENITSYMGGNVTNASVTSALPNFGMIIYNGVAYYISTIGQPVLLLLFSIPFITMWIIDGNLALVGVVGLLFSLYVFIFIGDAYALFCISAFAISIVAIIFGLLKRY
jgi:hypothetical protein